jgi:hypothetical protein
VRVDEGAQIAFCAVAGARQLFCKVRLGSRLAAFDADEGIGRAVGDVNAVGASWSPLEEASSST